MTDSKKTNQNINKNNVNDKGAIAIIPLKDLRRLSHKIKCFRARFLQ